MKPVSERPLVGVVSDRRMVDIHPFHMVGEKYLRGVWDGAEAYPVALPSLGEDFEVLELLGRLDGLLLTGSPSNVEPHHYNGPPSETGTWHDRSESICAVSQRHLPWLSVLYRSGKNEPATPATPRQSARQRLTAHSSPRD